MVKEVETLLFLVLIKVYQYILITEKKDMLVVDELPIDGLDD